MDCTQDNQAGAASSKSSGEVETQKPDPAGLKAASTKADGPKTNVLSGRLPSLDGWRALSIMMVFAAHATPDPAIRALALKPALGPLFDGNLGVRFFFVISGFLITYLLLREFQKTGRIDLWAFYTRRALRILPIYFAYLAVVAVLQLTIKVQQPAITWVGVLTFTVNFLPRYHIVGHLWSLSVEEQFYFLWPLTLVWLCSRNSFRRYAIVLAAPVIVAFVFHIIAREKAFPYLLHSLFTPYSSFLNFDSLDMGCIAGILVATREVTLRNFLAGKKHWILTALGAVLILLPWYSGAFPSQIVSYANEVAGRTLQAAGFAILLVSSVLYPRRFPMVNWSVVSYIGVLSYSLYIWHNLYAYPAPTDHFPDNLWFRFPGFIAAAFVTAAVSYYCLESPVLKLKNRFRRY
jgi:peptidoglycan/LPS O-acetylase OafA/YrhL